MNKTYVQHKLNINELFQPLLEHTLGKRTVYLIHDVALLEYYQGGNAANGVTGCNGGLLLGIDFDKAHSGL